jgi:predicted transcriptional regulator
MGKFLPMLVENGLLDYQPYNKTYKTAEKGLRFLRLYDQINQLAAIT